MVYGKKNLFGKLKYSQAKWNKSFGNNNKPIILWAALSFWQKLCPMRKDVESESVLFIFSCFYVIVFILCCQMCCSYCCTKNHNWKMYCYVVHHFVKPFHIEIRVFWLNTFSVGRNTSFSLIFCQLRATVAYNNHYYYHCNCGVWRVCVVGSLSRIVHQ